MPNPARNYRSSPISTRSVCRSAYLSEAPGWLRAVKRVSCKTGRSSPLVVVFLAVIALGFLLPASAQTTIFNCSSGFSSSGACQVGVFWAAPSKFWALRTDQAQPSAELLYFWHLQARSTQR